MNKIFLFFILKYIFSEIIKIPFGIINIEKDSSSYLLIDKLVYNKIYINLTIGTPPQKIKIFLRKDSDALFISEKNFNKNLSDSYYSNNKLDTFFFGIFDSTGYLSKEIINFGNYNNNKIKLDFISAVSDDNPLGALGLKIPFNYNEGISSFIYNLKNNSIISSYTFTLKYYSNKKLIESINDKYKPIGELIIGGEPHEYEENRTKYPLKGYHFVEAPVHSYRYYWDLKIKSIYILTNEKIEINNNKSINEVKLKSEYSVILGTKIYNDTIYINFFNKYEYMKNNICQELKIQHKTNFNYIECIKDDKLFDIKKFPSIYFESFEFNKTFELNYEDLFVLDEKTNKYIFLIIFPTNYIETVWNLGIPFLRKYQFTFNEDKKVIGFYNDEEGKKDKNIYNNNEKNDNNKIGLYILIGVLILIFCGLLIFIGMTIDKCLYREKRRKKANELDDGYDYESKGSINSNNNDNNKKESLMEE